MHSAETHSMNQSPLAIPAKQLAHLAWYELGDRELLATILQGHLSNQKASFDLADDVLDYFGTLAKLVAAAPEHIQQEYGDNQELATALLTMRLMVHRVAAGTVSEMITIDCPASLRTYINIQKIAHDQDHLSILYLNRNDAVIKDEHVLGDIGQSKICRNIAKGALFLNAKKLILIDYRPLRDKRTKASLFKEIGHLSEVLKLFQVTIHDYCLAYEEEYVSLLEQGCCT